MRPVQAAYYNSQSWDSRQQRPTKLQSQETSGYRVSGDQQQGPLNSDQVQLNYQTSSNQNMARNRQQVNSQQNYQKQGGYTEAEVNVLKGKGNEERQEYDLGKDGAFSDFRILVGCFYSEVYTAWNNNAGKALSQKGFKVTITTNEREFIKYLSDPSSFDVTWIVSNNTSVLNHDEQQSFKSAVLNFHRTGRGLFIFGDNTPYTMQVNWVLPDLVNTTISGNTPGQKVMGYGNGKVPGEFDADHLIFAGINYLYEGCTICFPQSDGKLTHIATSSDGRPCISFLESTPEHGRVVVDNGFTKLYMQWDSAGQARYVVNATVFLVDVERRIGDAKFEKK